LGQVIIFSFLFFFGGMEEERKKVIKYLGSRGWYWVYLITPDKYPQLLSLLLSNDKELVDWFRPVLKFLPFLRAGYPVGVIEGCHLAHCIKALGWWRFQFYRQVFHVFIPPAEWGDGSRNHEWVWVVKPGGRCRVYCLTCRERSRQADFLEVKDISPFFGGD
jgi:hypothetical protein